jgi:hypothetical protein
VQDLVPADHLLAVFLDDGLHTAREVSLEILIVLHVVLLLEGADAGVGVPLLAIHLISPDVKVGVGKQGGHFTDEAIQKRVDLLAGGIHAGIEDAPAALDEVGARPGGEFGMTGEPGGGVTRHIEFGDDADTAIAGVGQHLADLRLREVVAIGALALELRKLLTFDTKALVVGQVPVEDVEFDGSHGVEVTLEDIEGNPVARHVDHEAAPGKAGTVFDLHRGSPEAVRAHLRKLGEGGEATQYAQRCSRSQTGLMGGDAEAVGFVFAQPLDGSARMLAADQQGSGSNVRRRYIRNRDTRLVHELPHQAGGGGFEPRFPVAFQADPKRTVEDQASLPFGHVGGDRHQIVRKAGTPGGEHGSDQEVSVEHAFSLSYFSPKR